jgi:hypothetical protein
MPLVMPTMTTSRMARRKVADAKLSSSDLMLDVVAPSALRG